VRRCLEGDLPVPLQIRIAGPGVVIDPSPLESVEEALVVIEHMTILGADGCPVAARLGVLGIGESLE